MVSQAHAADQHPWSDNIVDSIVHVTLRRAWLNLSFSWSIRPGRSMELAVMEVSDSAFGNATGQSCVLLQVDVIGNNDEDVSLAREHEFDNLNVRKLLLE
ncbi:hypothetical protein PG996_013572 [Apiospora saccharicola]|uniref:Uncharacterized protein n=1 Tax=Apiospora saccharicola TaxID=335842 RepID=A0ABR1U5V4_9PEZI